MIANPFRSVLPRFAGPLVRLYERLGLTPNAVTGIAFVVAAYSVFLLFPERIEWWSAIWIAVLATTVVARTLLARRLLA